MTDKTQPARRLVAIGVITRRGGRVTETVVAEAGGHGTSRPAVKR